MNLNLTPCMPYSLQNEESKFPHTPPFMDESLPDSSCAMELYRHQSPISGGFLSTQGSEDKTMTQDSQLFEPAL